MIAGGGYGFGRSFGGNGYGYAVGLSNRGGWGSGAKLGRYAKKRTVAEYKKSYWDLTEPEIHKERLDIQANVRQARKEIELKQDLGLADVIIKLNAFIAVEKIKLAALQQVEVARLKRKTLDADLAFIAAYMMSDDDE